MAALLVLIVIVGGIMLGVHLNKVRENQIQDDIDWIIFADRRWDQNWNYTGRSLHGDNEMMVEGFSCDDFFELDDIAEVDDLIDT